MAKLPPGEAARRAKERQRRAFSGEGGPTYDPRKDGYGSRDQWQEAAGAKLAGKLPPASTADADLRLLGLDALPATPGLLLRAYRLMTLKVHPDVGGTAEDFRAVTSAHERLKRRVK